jgi:predicted nucleotidyltransferase
LFDEGADLMEIVAESVLAEIVRRLVAEFNPEEIILFGSRAWGQPRPDSDYDLFVVLAESADDALNRAVRAHHCLKGLGISKDVIVSTRERFDRFRRIRASLEADIHNRGVVLYGRRQNGVDSTVAAKGGA